MISETNGFTDMWCDGVQSPLQRIQSWSSTGNSLWALGSSDLPQCKIPQSPFPLQGNPFPVDTSKDVLPSRQAIHRHHDADDVYVCAASRPRCRW